MKMLPVMFLNQDTIERGNDVVMIRYICFICLCLSYL
jgi:hypothetical protein